MLLRLLSYVLPSFLVTYSIWYILYPVYFNHFCVLCFLSIISWTLGYYLYERFNQETVDPKNKIVLISGCDTGFGNRLAFKLDQLGYRVFAGVLFPTSEDVQKLKSRCSNRLTVVKMDVTKLEEVKDVIEQIKQTKMPLWAIVNNAGIAIGVPFDWGNDIDVFKKTLDVNLYGMIRVTNCSMPLLRQSKGRIINVASILGRTTLPYTSHYSMAKHGVRVFSDTLRRELIRTGIKVVTIEPSFYNTQINNKNAHKNMRQKYFNETADDIRSFYGENYLDVLDNTQKSIDLIMKNNIDEVVDSMVNGVILKHPKLFYRCCAYYELFTVFGASHLPEILLDALYSFWIERRMRKFKAGPYQKRD